MQNKVGFVDIGDVYIQIHSIIVSTANCTAIRVRMKQVHKIGTFTIFKGKKETQASKRYNYVEMCENHKTR